MNTTSRLETKGLLSNFSRTKNINIVPTKLLKQSLRSGSILSNRKTFTRKSLRSLKESDVIFYDIETDHQYAPYAKLRSIAVQYGLQGTPRMVVGRKEEDRFRDALADPTRIKVDFNGVNFDRTVCNRHGYFVHPQNAHDLYLIFKTIAPNLPAFALKFLAFYFLGDPHFPEMEMMQWMAENEKGWDEVPAHLLHPYNKHDVTQTKDLFRVAWDVVIRDEFWEPYLQDLMMGEPLYEMETEGGLYLDKQACSTALHRLQKKVQQETDRALELTHGQVLNANSSQQLAKYFTDFDGLELELTDSGQFRVDKAVLRDLRADNPLAECAYNIREANADMKYFENYLTALEDETYSQTKSHCWIPVQHSVSSARTRRFTSQSLYRLNFQNPSKTAEEVMVVPKGFLGWWIDATQIENVVHIFESNDIARRHAYESDPDWNEYVWLCNMTYGTDRPKEEWDDHELCPSPVIPHWTIYKDKKTTKLGLNFGMGVAKFCKMNKVDEDAGKLLFGQIHKACPAIRSLQNRVARDLKGKGFIEDVFGYRYAGPAEKAYKVMAYMIQGCGTGSLPKAQIRANWESMRKFDKYLPSQSKCGYMCETTHDENGGRIDLRLGEEAILQLLQNFMYNMTKKYSPLFDDIPLRAKLYLSKTSKANKIECDINDHERILQIIRGEPCLKCFATGKTGKNKCKACGATGYTL